MQGNESILEPKIQIKSEDIREISYSTPETSMSLHQETYQGTKNLIIPEDFIVKKGGFEFINDDFIILYD